MAKTIFITGASSGIGKATALLFAEKGWHVMATMRNPKNAKGLESENITLLPLDVTDVGQINQSIEKAVKISDIDIVLNNAGYGLAGSFEASTDAQLSNIINTNLLGVLRVTKAFIPYFRQKGGGLFITTTSIGGLLTFPFFSVYHATKWAVEGWSESVAYELKRFGISVKTVSPGSTNTDFASRSLDSAMLPAYENMFSHFLNDFLSPEVIINLSTPEQIAEVIYQAATDNKDQLRYIAGTDAITIYQQRQNLGVERFRKMIEEKYLKG
jgi:NAD(P)-dependent dehydrogenase (short-subunit alcohol dehydrogenase family)